MSFKIMDNGKEISCDVVCTFSDKNNNINYIIYKDGTKDENGDLEVYASRYKKSGNKLLLEAIENDYEWNLIDNMLKVYNNGSD